MPYYPPKRQTISLPQATFDFHRKLPDSTRMLFLGGRASSDAWTKKMLAQQVNPSIVAVDRGVALCRRLALVPDLLLGDADSAESEDWAWGEAHAKHVERHPVEKDFTDTQLALQKEDAWQPIDSLTKWKRERTESPMGEERTILLGAFGGRFDHAYSTIFSAAQIKMPCILADECETIVYLHRRQKVTIQCRSIPKAISLLPITSTVLFVTTTGLHWPLKSATLTQELPNTISNVLEEGTKKCTISLGDGCLAVYICWVNR